MNRRDFTPAEDAIYSKIQEVWKQHGWDWENNVGQAARRLACIIPEVFSDEFQEVRNCLLEISENLDKISFKSDRAADAFLLYKKLKREGADATLISYAVYAFLCGDTPVPVKPDMQQ